MDRIIDITPEEAMLIDLVLTMHSYDIALMEQLEKMKPLRKKIAVNITNDSSAGIEFSPEELEYLLITVPITYRFSQEDIGFSLKKKLLATLVPPLIIWNMEGKDELHPEDPPKPDENSPADETQDSTKA